MSETWPWVTLALLGAYHGLNPAMGWLFAVARGLQERRRAVVLQSLLPIALGHEASVAAVVLLVSVAGLVTEPAALRLGGAGMLVAFGLFKLLRPRLHPRWVGMRVGARELVLWSFLMSSAHGAGLMLLPVLLGSIGHDHAGHDHRHAALDLGTAALGVNTAAVVVHTAAMLVVMGLVAVVVYEKVGLRVLRWAWVNMDLLWSAAIVGAGVLTLFL